MTYFAKTIDKQTRALTHTGNYIITHRSINKLSSNRVKKREIKLTQHRGAGDGFLLCFCECFLHEVWNRLEPQSWVWGRKQRWEKKKKTQVGRGFK